MIQNGYSLFITVCLVFLSLGVYSEFRDNQVLGAEIQTLTTQNQELQEKLAAEEQQVAACQADLNRTVQELASARQEIERLSAVGCGQFLIPDTGTGQVDVPPPVASARPLDDLHGLTVPRWGWLLLIFVPLVGVILGKGVFIFLYGGEQSG